MPVSLTSSVHDPAHVPARSPQPLTPAASSSAVPQGIEALAALLFELRAAYEADLRALTSMQRSLERARCDGASHGERELLLGEIARLLDQAEAASHATADVRRQAGERVAGCRMTLSTLPDPTPPLIAGAA